MSIAPIECYVIQGEIPLPEVVVQRFSKTGGELCRGLFLLSTCYNIYAVQSMLILFKASQA